MHSAGVQEVSGGRGGKCVGGRTIDVSSGASLTCNRGPLRVIKDVECFGAEFNGCALLDGEVLEDRHVEVDEVRIAQAVSAGVSKCQCCWRCIGRLVVILPTVLVYRVRSNFRIADDIGIGVGAISVSNASIIMAL